MRELTFRSFREPEFWETAYSVFWAITIAPVDKDSQVSVLPGLAKRALRKSRQSSYEVWNATLEGMALYRTNKFDEAIVRLLPSAEHHVAPEAWLILAMAFEKTGKHNQAGPWLKKASSWIEKHEPHEKGSSGQCVVWS